MKHAAGKFVIMVLALSGIVLTGCEKKEDAPQLPPESAFVMDMSAFQSQGKTTQTSANWATAAIIVGVWNTILAVNLAVPVAAYIEAIEHDPVRVDNDTWKWSYSVTVHSVAYSAELLADVSGSDVNWKMYLSQQGGFKDFLWYKGTCDILRTRGEWTLYQSPFNTNEYLHIGWTHDWEKNTGDIKYTSIVPGTEGFGSYIHYGANADAPEKLFYALYDAAKDQQTEILYDPITREGSIFYNDTWHCWSSDLEDIECPAR